MVPDEGRSRFGGASVRVAVAALGALAALAIGCGPSPAYDPEPRVPVAYEPVPLSSQELAAQNPTPPATTEVAPSSSDVAIGADDDAYADTDPSALTEFRPVLEDHGQWVDDSTYGTVWVPAEREVGSDFQPYVSAGHWTYSDTTNWVWVSDYSWGWAPFHYGRWVYLSGYGWSWIPGRRYAGAWVVWRTGPYGYDYIGWAPAPPDYYWYNGWAVGWSFGWYYPTYYYCPHRYMGAPVVGTYVVRGGTPAAAPIEARTQPYQPATPGVGGRVPAQPGVAGAGRVVASPSVAGAGHHAIATPGVGPKPADLGMATNKLPAPPADDKGLTRAMALGSPRTAASVGAAPPASFGSRAAAATRPRRIEPDAVAGAPRAGSPQEAPRPISPYVANRLAPAARAPQVSGVAPIPPRQSSALPEVRSAPHASTVTPPPLVSREPLVPRFDAPARSAPPPAVHSSPSYGSSFGSSSSPAWHSSPSVHASPSFHSAPSAPFHSSPSFTPHVSSPSHVAPSHHSSPSTSVGRSIGGRRGR